MKQRRPHVLDVQHFQPVSVGRGGQRKGNACDRVAGPETAHGDVGIGVELGIERVPGAERVQHVFGVALKPRERTHEAAHVRAIPRSVLFRGVGSDADLHGLLWMLPSPHR